MELKSVLEDSKVSARSVLIEISIEDYLALARQILTRNQFQRKRVRGSKSVYSLLKADILAGCVMPPLVLAYTKAGGNLEADLRASVINDSEHFVILDGLQRTYSLLDIESEVSVEDERRAPFLARKIRCEIYEGINRIGILYRMLTLNTGQTAMSLRHQIEIMYLGYLDIDLGGVKLIREGGGNARQISEYNFKDVIEGFNSYIERTESPLDRGDILDNIAGLWNLAKENNDHDLFKEFILSWDRFIRKVDDFQMSLPRDADDNDDQEPDEAGKREWAFTGIQAFKRSQALAGFGAAIGLLGDEGEQLNFNNLPIDQIQVGAEPGEFIAALNESIAMINKRAKRIGNAQRLFFRQFFKMLFWAESGSYLDLYRSQDEAYKSSVKIGI